MLSLIITTLGAQIDKWLFTRVTTALLGGYLLAHTMSIVLVSVWSLAPADAVLAAAQLGFLVYAGAVIWVFGIRSLWLACLGLGAVILVSAVLAWWFLW